MAGPSVSAGSEGLLRSLLLLTPAPLRDGKTKALSVWHHFHCREEKMIVWAGKTRDCSHIYMTQVTVLGGERTAMKHAEPCHREKQEQDVNPPGEGEMGI